MTGGISSDISYLRIVVLINERLLYTEWELTGRSFSHKFASVFQFLAAHERVLRIISALITKLIVCKY